MLTAVCDSCGNVFELDENRKEFADLYSRGDDAWSRKDFDEAIKFYEQIVEENNAQSEAHFSIALCRYGIAYELDPVTLKEMPTCNRINRDSILNDKNYLAAIKYAGDQTRALYVERAQQIDKISREFLKIADQEEPYDVFISYKRTDADGRRTIDSQLAMKLYLYLRDQGIRAFFAEQTLKDVGGEKYEPYIFAALHSSKVMLLVGSCKQHVEATWVKNEWRRFLHLSQNDPKKVLIPCYIGNDFYDIFPSELLSIQGYDMRSPVFHEEITENIKKKLGGKVSSPQAGTKLEDRYAKPDAVKKVVETLDCDEDLAVKALVLFQGNVPKTIEYISEDKEYQKSRWVCTECNTVNTGDVCRNKDCGISKSDSLKIAEDRRRVAEKRQKEAARKKRDTAASMKKFAIILAALLVVGAVIFGIFALINYVIIPYLIVPNQENPDLNTPDIVKTYCATKEESSWGNTTKWEYIFTITACDEEGNITATKEIIRNGVYGKYSLTGKITSKKNNGEITIDFTAGAWEVELSDYERNETFTAKISKDHNKITGDDITYTAGGDEKYNISSAADLQKLQNAEGLFMIKEDIDLTGTSFTPIEGFKGTLIGNNHTIKGLKIESSSDNVGFFSTLNGTVKGLNFEEAEVTVTERHENIGIFCGKLESGTVLDIKVSGTVTADTGTNVGGVIGNVAVPDSYTLSGLSSSGSISGMDHVGGVIGGVTSQASHEATVTLSNFQNSAAVTGTNDSTGGVAGYVVPVSQYRAFVLKLSGMKNTGDITGKFRVGGIFGYAESGDAASILSDAHNSSSVTGEHYVGCIGGQFATVAIDRCSNTGSTLTANGHTTVDGEKYAYVGGFVGSGFLANNCTNEAEINYTGTGRYVGGIMGYSSFSGNFTMTGLSNKAAISGYSHVGGIFGGVLNRVSHEGTLELTKLENTAAITSAKDYVGGIIGHMELNSDYRSIVLKASELKNSGNITGKHFTGGIFGYATTGSAESAIQDCSNSSAVSGESYVGCIGGYMKSIVINDCSNTDSTLIATGYTTVDGEKLAYVGGFAGYGFLANNCVNEVEINYEGTGRYVAGIIGYTDASGNFKMSGLKNNASITGYSYVAGLIGYMSSSFSHEGTVELSNFENTAAIVGRNNYVGGLIAYLKVDSDYREAILYASDFRNDSTITGNSNIGKLIGYGETDSSESCIIDAEYEGYVGNLKNIAIK